jgi:chaperonin GroES
MANKNNKIPEKQNVHIQPLGDRVLVRPFTVDEAEGEAVNHFGIILPESVSKEKSGQGIVLAVGTGRYIDGVLVPTQVAVGDRVIFSKYSYDEVEEKGQDLYLLREDNLLAVIK